MKYLGNIGFRTAVAALTVAVALSQPISAQARGGGGGFHGDGGFHGGDGFHGGGFHGEAFHGAGFRAGGFGHATFGGDHSDRFRDHGFNSWGWDDAWPLVTSPDLYEGDGYTYDGAPGSSSSAQYWYYCQNPAGYYPYVTSCTTTWQPVPAS